MTFIPILAETPSQTIFVIGGIAAFLFVFFMFVAIWASRYTKVGPNQVLVSTVSLTATASGASSITLSWPLSAGAYALQYRTALNSGAWATLSTPAAQMVGSQWQVMLSPPTNTGSVFYRLAK